MSEHKQMQPPPDYHRCLETVFSSPAACREILERLSKMTEAEVQSRWSPWVDQEPPHPSVRMSRIKYPQRCSWRRYKSHTIPIESRLWRCGASCRTSWASPPSCRKASSNSSGVCV